MGGRIAMRAPKRPYTEAREKAEALDKALQADDLRLGRNVFLTHRDRSVLHFTNAFALTFGEHQEFVIILTEHHGAHVYHEEDLMALLQMDEDGDFTKIEQA